jgi:hypothetical protein
MPTVRQAGQWPANLGTERDWGFRTVPNPSRCITHDSGKPGPVIRGSLHPDEFMVLNDHSVAFAVTHSSVRPDSTPVDEFLSFRVQPDGRLVLRNVVLNPATYAIQWEAAFDCEIGKSVTFN